MRLKLNSFPALIQLWALVAFAGLAIPAAAQVSVAPVIRAAVSHEIIILTTGDGLQIPAVLAYPAEGLNPAGPVVLHLPDGPGGGPLRPTDAARYIADGLAARGFASLSIETRLTSSYPFSRFDEGIADVRAAVDMLAARGFSGVVVAGNGLGSLLAARYVVETGDARVRALIHYAPSPDLVDTWRAKVGEESYWRMVDAASKAVNEWGRGRFIDLGDGLIFTPATFLDWYGPTAKTSLTANMAGVNLPMFLAAGANDPAITKGRLEQLKAIAFLSRRVDLKYYANTGHAFDGVQEELIDDTAAWLADIGFGVVPQVTTTPVTVTAKDGTRLAGVLYAPSGAARDPARPAFMVMHGWTGDIMRSVPLWLGERLAQRGFTVLAFQHRASGFRGTVGGKLEDVPQDIAPWVDFMANRGHRNIFGVGHTVGGLWLSHYLSQTNDSRIRGMIYLSPARDLPQYARAAMGEDLYARVVLEAQEAVRDGKGATHLIDAPFPQVVYDEDSRQIMFLSVPGSGFTYYYADAFLSYWGPNSAAVHTQRIAQVDVPILALGGARDPMMQGAYLIQFTEAAGGPAEYIFYSGPNGAPQSFEGYETRVTDDILAWIEKAF